MEMREGHSWGKEKSWKSFHETLIDYMIESLYGLLVSWHLKIFWIIGSVVSDSR